MPAFEDVPEDLKKLFPPGLCDIGGKSVLEMDDRVVQICREEHEYYAKVLEKSIALAENIKLNGSDFEETWAGMLVLGRKLTAIGGWAAPITLAYVLSALAFPEELKRA
jgi:hypothetical protein